MDLVVAARQPAPRLPHHRRVAEPGRPPDVLHHARHHRRLEVVGQPGHLRVLSRAGQRPPVTDLRVADALGRRAEEGDMLPQHATGPELAVARENEFTVEEVDLAIHAHPTLSEAVAQATLDSLGRVLDA